MATCTVRTCTSKHLKVEVTCDMFRWHILNQFWKWHVNFRWCMSKAFPYFPPFFEGLRVWHASCGPANGETTRLSGAWWTTGKDREKNGHCRSFKSEVMWIPRWRGFLSHTIEEMFTKFGCHQLESGVGSLFCFRSIFQRFYTLQVARFSSGPARSINALGLPIFVKNIEGLEMKAWVRFRGLVP